MWAMTYWILDGHTPVPTEDIKAYGQMYDSKERIVAQTTLPNGLRVSTVFLALDHNFGEDGPPILFETMVFEKDSWNEIECERYATWDEAQAGHDAMVAQFQEQPA